MPFKKDNLKRRHIWVSLQVRCIVNVYLHYLTTQQIRKAEKKVNIATTFANKKVNGAHSGWKMDENFEKNGKNLNTCYF